MVYLQEYVILSANKCKISQRKHNQNRKKMCLFSTCSLNGDKKKSYCQKRERRWKKKVTETLSKTTENCGGHSPSRQSSKIWDSSKFSIISMWWINNKTCPLISLIYKKKIWNQANLCSRTGKGVQVKLWVAKISTIKHQYLGGELILQHFRCSSFYFHCCGSKCISCTFKGKKKDHFLTEWQIWCISIREREFDTHCLVITRKFFFNNTTEIYQKTAKMSYMRSELSQWFC